jgi:hypothetical protein
MALTVSTLDFLPSNKRNSSSAAFHCNSDSAAMSPVSRGKITAAAAPVVTVGTDFKKTRLLIMYAMPRFDKASMRSKRYHAEQAK